MSPDPVVVDVASASLGGSPESPDRQQRVEIVTVSSSELDNGDPDTSDADDDDLAVLEALPCQSLDWVPPTPPSQFAATTERGQRRVDLLRPAPPKRKATAATTQSDRDAAIAAEQARRATEKELLARVAFVMANAGQGAVGSAADGQTSRCDAKRDGKALLERVAMTMAREETKPALKAEKCDDARRRRVLLADPNKPDRSSDANKASVSASTTWSPPPATSKVKVKQESETSAKSEIKPAKKKAPLFSHLSKRKQQ